MLPYRQCTCISPLQVGISNYMQIVQKILEKKPFMDVHHKHHLKNIVANATLESLAIKSAELKPQATHRSHRRFIIPLLV